MLGGDLRPHPGRDPRRLLLRGAAADRDRTLPDRGRRRGDPRRAGGRAGPGDRGGAAMSMAVTSLPDAEPRPRKVAIGTFDGVHLGHQAAIEGADTVLTFDPHPLEVLHPAATPKLIMPFNVKRDVIEGLGGEELVVTPFHQEFAHRSAEDFVEHVLLEKLDAKQVSVVENFRFGAKAKGDAAMLESRPEFQARVVPVVKVDF